MKKTFLLLLLFLPYVTRAQNIEVSGLQTGTWNSDTVFVVGDVVVDGSLVVEPGTAVVFRGFYGITATEASFKAVGTEDDSIVFTVLDTTNFYLYDAPRGGWNGLTFNMMTEPVELKYCKFSFGKASFGTAYKGGAVRIFNSNADIANCVFHCNFTRESGGALYAENASLIILDCEVADNLGYNNDGNIYMYGGGMFFLACEVEMSGMKFHGNHCESCCGGGVCFDNCSVKLDKSIFEDNLACNGGGISFLRCNDKDVLASNLLLTGNSALHYGGAIHFGTSSPEIDNVTMVDNQCIGAGGGAVMFFGDSRPKFTNCIIWGNHWADSTTIIDGSQVWIWSVESLPNFFNSVLQYGAEGIHNPMFLGDYVNMLDSDPLLVDPENRDFRLLYRSPCRDSGSPDIDESVLSGTDLDGNQRVSNCAIDMGAYEYDASSVGEGFLADRKLVISTNPIASTSQANLTLQQSGDVVLRAYSVTGSLVWEQQFSGLAAGEQRLSLEGLYNTVKSGAYLVEAITPERRHATLVVR